MRVLLIDVNFREGSTGKIVNDLYTSLLKDGHEVCVCYGRGSKVKGENIIKISTDIETYLHGMLTRLTGITSCFFSPFSTRKLIGIIDKFKPDVVHIHDPKTYYMNIRPLVEYLKKKDIKTVWTFHSEFMYTGKCGHALDCSNWKTECKNCPQLREYPKSLFFDFTKAMFRQKKKMFNEFNKLTIVAPSGWLANRINSSFLKNKNVVVVNNGIDTDTLFYPRKHLDIRLKHNIKDEKVILTVAPNLMSDLKGGKHIIQVAKKMRGFKFIMIGINDLSKKFPENVIPIGRIMDQNLLAKYYSMADLFILCSLRETFSLTCAESLACGTPVVGFKAGAPETISLQNYSSFVEYGDADKLAEEVEKWVNKKSMINTDEMVAEAKSKYSKLKMYQQYIDLYK